MMHFAEEISAVDGFLLNIMELIFLKYSSKISLPFYCILINFFSIAFL